MHRLLCPIALAAAVPAFAEEPPARALTVVNDTSAAVNQLFVDGGKRGGLRAKVAGVFGTPDGARDRLESKMLPRGGSLAVELRGDRCRYDLRAVLEDGRTFTADDFDVCTNARWRISQGVRR